MYVLEWNIPPFAASRKTLAVCESRSPLEHVRRGLSQPPELRITFCPCTVEQYLSHAARNEEPCFYGKAG